MHESWSELFALCPQFKQLLDLENDKIYPKLEPAQIIYPAKENIFRVFEMDVNEIRILLLGQDPYHGAGQANGLSFSVPVGVDTPPSLKNIYKELQLEFPERNYVFPTGCIDRWFTHEKIFLLNSSLTVYQGKAGSMMGIWSAFTDEVIKFVGVKNPNCVFVLLGNFSKNKAKYITNKDKIVFGVHPSPLSAYKGFFGSGIFKEIEAKVGAAVDWSV